VSLIDRLADVDGSSVEDCLRQFLFEATSDFIEENRPELAAWIASSPVDDEVPDLGAWIDSYAERPLTEASGFNRRLFADGGTVGASGRENLAIVNEGEYVSAAPDGLRQPTAGHRQ
jgi:hypothetical protein